MSMWKFVLAGAVLTAMVFLPAGELPDVSSVAVPELKPASLANLTLERINPAAGLSRTPVATYSASQKPLSGVRVLVDPGHGGQEKWDKLLYCGGTVGVSTAQTESDVNLRVALCLRQYLEAAGADVVMTRISDDRCTKCGDKRDELDFRSDLANSMRCDLFISVHHNEAPRAQVNHTLAFYPQGRSDSVSLADNVASAVA
jgi:N-acetylmuramoyl-L-alanine amidase